MATAAAPPSGPVHIDTLERQLKTILYELGQLVDWHTKLHVIKVAPYVPNAPSSRIAGLAAAVKAFETECSALEDELLRARAVIERDQRRAAGVLTTASPADVAAPAAASDATVRAAGDDEALNVDLFGMSPPASAAEAAQGSTAATAFDLDALMATPQLPTSAAPDADPTASMMSIEDLQALLFPGGMPAAAPAPSSQADMLGLPTGSATDMDVGNFDIDALLASFGDSGAS